MRILLAALSLATVVAGCSAADGEDESKEVLYFSAIPDQSSTELAEKFGKVADYLGKELGVDVRYRAASDYGASVEMFRNGDIQLAWFGGLTGCQARAAVDGARAIAQGESDPKFISYFIAHASTGLERSDDFPLALADLTFTFGSEKSTSGRLMPEYYLRKHSGKSPKEFFKQQYLFSGSHPKTAQAVASGRVQAGALNFKVYDKMVAEGKIDPAVCRIVWKTPPYADYNWTAHPELDTRYGAGFIDRLQKALVGMKGDLLDVFPRNALIPAENKEFDGIAAVARELGLMR